MKLVLLCYLSHQGLPCLPFCLHLLDTLLYGKTKLLQFLDNDSNFLCVHFFNPSLSHNISNTGNFPSQLAKTFCMIL